MLFYAISNVTAASADSVTATVHTFAHIETFVAAAWTDIKYP
jgi:hypothetical protein